MKLGYKVVSVRKSLRTETNRDVTYYVTLIPVIGLKLQTDHQIEVEVVDTSYQTMSAKVGETLSFDVK